MTSGGAGGIVIQMWRIVPGPVDVSEDDRLAGPHPHVRARPCDRRALRRPLPARASRVLEGDRAAVERRVDEGRVLERLIA